LLFLSEPFNFTDARFVQILVTIFDACFQTLNTAVKLISAEDLMELSQHSRNISETVGDSTTRRALEAKLSALSSSCQRLQEAVGMCEFQDNYSTVFLDFVYQTLFHLQAG